MGNLIVYDGKNFLDKYMRFMSKDVYISKDMSKKFLDGYKYLLDEVKSEQYLYQDQVDITRIKSIFYKNDKVLKYHNQKYLNKAVDTYQEFFNNLYSDDILDKNKKFLVLMQENQIYSIISKNYIPFIVTKLAYLKNICKVSSRKMLVLVDNYVDLSLLNSELSSKGIDGVRSSTLSGYRLSTLEGEENYFDYSSIYKLMLAYVMDLFSDKKRFSYFLQLFSNYIYLNKDYKKFDNFGDYHNYLYCKKYEDSGLSLKKYNEKEIKLRRMQLRTIQNEFVTCKEMVDVANFLYLNSIDYNYDKEESVFICHSLKGIVKIGFSLNIDSDDVISLDIHNKKYLEVFIYELIKRRFPFVRRDDSSVYEMLRDSTVDSYFCELIKDILIPFVVKMQGNNDMKNTYFDGKQVKELKYVYDYYLSYLKKHSYVDDFCLDNRVRDKINSSSYEYVILLGDISSCFDKNCIHVVKDYSDLYLFRNHIKFMYDYKSYLKNNKYLLGVDNYMGKVELLSLTSSFLKNHLHYLNEQLMDIHKKIFVCFYDDSNRVKTNRYLTDKIYQIIDREKDKKILLGLDKDSDVHSLVRDDMFIRVNKNVLRSSFGDIDCKVISRVRDSYDVIILSYLIRDIYHRDMFCLDDMSQVKIFIYMAFSYCKDSLYLLCPNSRKEEYRELFDKLLDVQYFE